MTVPATDAFEEFLAGLQVTQTLPSGAFVTLTDTRVMMSGAPGSDLHLSYPSGGVPLKVVLKHVAKTLRRQGCIADARVAALALAWTAVVREGNASNVAQTNALLEQTHIARLRQSVIFPGFPPPGYQLPMGTYSIRSFDPDGFLHWAERCGSKFPVDLRSLRRLASLERDPSDVCLLAVQDGEAVKAKFRGSPDVVATIFDCYYGAVSRAFARSIEDQVKRDVLVLEGGALFSIDVESVLSQLLVRVVSMFTWKTDGRFSGWATYSSQEVLQSNFPPAESQKESIDWLSAELGFTKLMDHHPFDKAIMKYCSFLQRAQGHKRAGRFDEAYLHFVIAIDLLLGVEGQSTESVATRAAVITYRQLGESLDVVIKRIKGLYNARSKYVHDGRAVDRAEVAGVEQVAREILWTLLAASARRSVKDADDWVRRIGYILAGVRAGWVVPEEEFAAVGVPAGGSRRVPPNHVDGSNAQLSLDRIAVD